MSGITNSTTNNSSLARRTAYGKIVSDRNKANQLGSTSTTNNQSVQPKTGPFAGTRVETVTNSEDQLRMQAVQSHSDTSVSSPETGTSASDSTRTTNPPDQPNNHIPDILLTSAVGAVMQVGVQEAVDHHSCLGHVANFWNHTVNSCHPGIDGHPGIDDETTQNCLRGFGGVDNNGHNVFDPSNDTFSDGCTVG